MNCLIIDDEENSRISIKRLLSLDSSLLLVGEYGDTAEAFTKIRDNQVDLIFLEIGMPGIGGLELARMLKGRPPMIIFITSFSEHALEAFDLNVVDYLLKPLMPDRFFKAVEKAKAFFQQKQITLAPLLSEFTFIRDSNRTRRLRIRDILYLEAAGDYVRIRLDSCTYTIHTSLKKVEEKLPQHIFLRIHRSFIVNLEKIDGTEGTTLVVKGNMLPVSEIYRPKLNKCMQFL